MTVNSRPRGRPPLPDGHRIPVVIKLSDAEAALIESARGATPRAAWMREAILLAARRNPGILEPPAAAPRRNPGILEPEPVRIGGIEIPIIIDERQPPGVVSVIAPGEDRTQVASFALAPDSGIRQPERTRKPRASAAPPAVPREPAPAAGCRHPANRRIGDYCGACQQTVGKGSNGK